MSSIKARNIIFLYAELTPYFIGCLDYFTEKNPSYKVHVIFKDVFTNIKLKESPGIRFISDEVFNSRENLFKCCFDLKPCLLFVSGRMYSNYLYVAKMMKNITIRVTVQDTIYTNSLKQILTRKFSYILYMQYYDKFWGIGKLQKKFANDIGFRDQDIFNGFYVADNKFFKKSKVFAYEGKDLNILFIGRLVKEKNILRLINVINKINYEENSNHKISIIGHGPLINKIREYKIVNYLGLKTQNEIIEIALKCDVFCLPSIYEPWGVVTHEMTALGMPIIASKLCGSSHDLVNEGYNGFTFNPYDKSSIKGAFEKFISLSKSEKRNLSLNSIEISKKITHDNWNQTIISILN